MATLSAQVRREAEMLERRWGRRTCDCCGVTILLGERTLHRRLGGRPEEVCLSCGGVLKDSSKSAPSHWPGPSDVVTRTEGIRR